MNSTVVFLDIDGAICPYDRDWRRSGVYSLSTEYTYRTITNLRVPIAEHVEDFLRWLTPEEAVWSSSWGDISVDINDAIETDHFDYMMNDKDLIQGKSYSLAKYLKNHPEITKVILVEDEPYDIATDVEIVYVTTDRFTGLTIEQTDFLRDLIEQDR